METKYHSPKIKQSTLLILFFFTFLFSYYFSLVNFFFNYFFSSPPRPPPPTPRTPPPPPPHPHLSHRRQRQMCIRDRDGAENHQLHPWSGESQRRQAIVGIRKGETRRLRETLAERDRWEPKVFGTCR